MPGPGRAAAAVVRDEDLAAPASTTQARTAAAATLDTVPPATAAPAAGVPADHALLSTPEPVGLTCGFPAVPIRAPACPISATSVSMSQ